VARAASGELLSSNLSSVGPQWWLMPLVLATEFAIGIGFSIFTPIAIRKIRESRDDAKENI
jgi:hypothetical protein